MEINCTIMEVKNKTVQSFRSRSKKAEKRPSKLEAKTMKIIKFKE